MNATQALRTVLNMAEYVHQPPDCVDPSLRHVAEKECEAMERVEQLVDQLENVTHLVLKGGKPCPLR